MNAFRKLLFRDRQDSSVGKIAQLITALDSLSWSFQNSNVQHAIQLQTEWEARWVSGTKLVFKKTGQKHPDSRQLARKAPATTSTWGTHRSPLEDTHPAAWKE